MPASTLTVGNVQIISILDTQFELPWQVIFPGKDPQDFDPYRGRYPASHADGRFRTQASAYALRSEGKTVLCDTGIGPGPIQFLGGLHGHLLDDMANKGIKPEDIDLVVHTHLHGDHVGWNLSADGKPNFPNARYLVPQSDWDFFSNALAANPQMQQVTPLQDLGVMDLFSGEHAITPEITTYPTPGHTPGHSSLMISSAGERALITGDLAHHPAQVEHTDWCSGFDMDHPQTAETRQKVFDQLEADGFVVAFCHFPEPFGKLIRAEGKRIFEAL